MHAVSRGRWLTNTLIISSERDLASLGIHKGRVKIRVRVKVRIRGIITVRVRVRRASGFTNALLVFC